MRAEDTLSEYTGAQFQATLHSSRRIPSLTNVDCLLLLHSLRSYNLYNQHLWNTYHM